MHTSAGTVLIVDPERDSAYQLRAHCVQAGLDVHLIHDIESAIDCMGRCRPHVLVTSDALPDVRGTEAIRTLHQAAGGQGIAVIAITSSTNPETIVRLLDAGAVHGAVRPIDLAELTARIKAHVALVVAAAAHGVPVHLSDELRHKTDRLELLYAYSRSLAHARSEDQIYKLLVDTVQKATNSQRVSVMLFDEPTGKLVCKHARGIDAELAEKLAVDPDSGIAGQVFTTGTTVVAQTVDATGRGGRNYASDKFLSTPLVSTLLADGEQRLGVLNVTDKPDGESFSPEEITCINSIADSAAVALHSERRRSMLKKSIRALLLTVGRLSEYRDEETGLHLERVRDYASVLVRQLAQNPNFASTVTPQFMEDLCQAAPLHDIGKVGISDDILNKPGKLTDEEFQIMKTHTTIGRHTLSLAIEETEPVPLLLMCLDIAYCHHERYDGKGYPRGIAADEIPLAARIITLVDAYDAMTSQRCYKKAMSHQTAVGNVRSERGGHFDPEVVDAFLAVADEFDRIRKAKADEVSAGSGRQTSTQKQWR